MICHYLTWKIVFSILRKPGKCLEFGTVYVLGTVDIGEYSVVLTQLALWWKVVGEVMLLQEAPTLAHHHKASLSHNAILRTSHQI